MLVSNDNNKLVSRLYIVPVCQKTTCNVVTFFKVKIFQQNTIYLSVSPRFAACQKEIECHYALAQPNRLPWSICLDLETINKQWKGLKHRTAFSFHVLLINDECAQAMKIEYGGRNVTFSDGDLSDNYTLEVNQSLIYIFTMYLQLADGHEMVFWN